MPVVAAGGKSQGEAGHDDKGMADIGLHDVSMKNDD
jgi:hypothetical protein